MAKWRKRTAVEDAPLSYERSTVLTPEQEAARVASRKQTLPPPDGCLSALQASIPGLTRSSPHRCFQRHGSSRLPEVAITRPTKKVFRTYPIGYFHVASAEVRTEEGERYLFMAIDRTTRFAHAELLPRAGKMAAARLLRNLVAAVPQTTHTVRADNGIQFTNR